MLHPERGLETARAFLKAHDAVFPHAVGDGERGHGFRRGAFTVHGLRPFRYGRRFHLVGSPGLRGNELGQLPGPLLHHVAVGVLPIRQPLDANLHAFGFQHWPQPLTGLCARLVAIEQERYLPHAVPGHEPDVRPAQAIGPLDRDHVPMSGHHHRQGVDDRFDQNDFRIGLHGNRVPESG